VTESVREQAVQPVVRRLTDEDEATLRRLFHQTMVMGHPLPFSLADGGRYESLCLDWYLGRGREDAVVVDAEGEIVGFALVCTDQVGYRHWVRGRAARYAVYSVLTLCRTNPRSPLARFHRSRLHDGWVMWRSPPPPFPAHAHVNVLPHRLARWAGKSLLDSVDERCRAAGVPGWYGEINALVGKRAAALARVVGPIEHRAPNHTLTWLMGRPVERLTVTRAVPTVGEAAA
jgi:GNAT superfamily N-acetyltransferase